MNHTVSDRGFVHMEPVEGTGNVTVRVYESSSSVSFWPKITPSGGIEQGKATGPFIWLRIETRDFDRRDAEPVEASAHLPLDAARTLRDQLSFLIDQSEPDIEVAK